MQKFILALLLSACSFVALAQKGASREELERRRMRLLEAIKATQAELATTRQNKQVTLGQLQALQAQVDARQRLIGSINTELGQIDGNIRNSQEEVDKLSAEVAFLRARYAQSIRYAYRNRNAQSMMAYLFSASGFNDGIRRLSYLRKFRDYRMAQADEIREVQGNLHQKIGVLHNEKTRKSVLRQAEEGQKKVLQQEAAQTNKAVRELRGRESELSASVVKNQRDAKNLERAISDAIRREIEIARKKAMEEARRQAELQRRQEAERQRLAADRAAADREIAARAAAANKAKAAEDARNKAANGNKGNSYGGVTLNTGSGNNANRTVSNPNTTNPPPPDEPADVETTPSKGTSPLPRPPRPVRRDPVNLGLTPEAAALSASFESNRGRLPWPVEKGFIVSNYGRHKHAVAEKVMVENNGVDIQTSAGATARAVFEGTVSKVLFIAGFGQNIIINHGNYFTVYNGLSTVSVSAGQKVHTKQAIGTVGPNEDGIHVLKFQVWKGAATQNPTGWIAQ